jgi:hypothetical protein
MAQNETYRMPGGRVSVTIVPEVPQALAVRDYPDQAIRQLGDGSFDQLLGVRIGDGIADQKSRNVRTLGETPEERQDLVPQALRNLRPAIVLGCGIQFTQ